MSGADGRGSNAARIRPVEPAGGGAAEDGDAAGGEVVLDRGQAATDLDRGGEQVGGSGCGAGGVEADR